MSDAVTRASHNVRPGDLPEMTLQGGDLPAELRGFTLAEEDELDNDTMARHSFSGNTAGRFREIGRITGYLREFVNPESGFHVEDGTVLVAATVVHLFKDETAVRRWIDEIFLRQFHDNVGKPLSTGHELVAVDQREIDGFYHDAVAILGLYRQPDGFVSSAVVDFRLGRLLGVAFVIAAGDCDKLTLAQDMAATLERQMARVLLVVD